MSEPAKKDSVDSIVEPSKDVTKEEFVQRKAYEEVTSDMHKFKSQAKESSAKANELEAKLKALEESKMKEQNRYQELYEQEKKLREESDSNRGKDKDLYLRAVKKSALKSALGGEIQDEYLVHANVDAIEIRDDGTLSSESVDLVANSFREKHSQLIPSSGGGTITSNPSPANGTIGTVVKTLGQMTTQEKVDYYNANFKKRN